MEKVILPLLAGLGIFFAGVKLVGQNLKQLTSRRFRVLVSQWADSSWRAGLLGAAILLITQSGSAFTFIVVSLISSGFISVRKALPMIIGANAGGAFLVLIVMLDIRPLILVLLGLTGISLYLDRPVKYREAVGALFGLGLLFFGLQAIKTGAQPLSDLGMVQWALSKSGHSYLLALGAGALFSFLIQSSPAVSVVAIAMTEAGLLNVEQTMMAIYGTNLGSSLTVWFLSAGLKGTPKQMAMAQAIFNVIGCVIFIILFYLELFFQGVPLVKNLVLSLTPDIAKQMAYVYFIFNFGTAVLLAFFLNPLYDLLNRYWPPTKHEDRSKPQYLYHQALEEPETAMDLVTKEQQRLLELVPDYLTAIRTKPSLKVPSKDEIHTAFQSLFQEVQAFLNGLMDKNLAPETAERLINLINRQDTINSIEENTLSLAENLERAEKSKALSPLAGNILEGTDTILLTAVETLYSNEAGDREILKTMTQDRGSLMEGIRQAYLNTEEGLDVSEKAVLLRVTNLFERVVWMTNRLAKLLDQAQ